MKKRRLQMKRRETCECRRATVEMVKKKKKKKKKKEERQK
jgi:hypothetical protein